MQKFQLVLLIHAHQPVGNFDEVMERVYAESYLPFLDVLARHPQIRLGLHYSGPLLEWIEGKHPEYFDHLRALIANRQVEMVGGGFYEPILVTIPPDDRQEQITRMDAYLEKQFETHPQGAWLAERVWEPQVPSSLAAAGVEYTLVDDTHFLGAGFELDQLYGYYISEDLGRTVKVLPGLKILRYLIPFRDVPETIEFLRGAANSHPGGFAATGDDLEKFGVWPGTHEHCYRNGWLDRFFSALEENLDWLSLSTPGDAISSHAPLGRAVLPTASYGEMMEWSLPTPARKRFHDLLGEFSSRPDVLPFIRGGIWRGFLTKYSEANLLHKKMLHASRKIGKLARNRRSGSYLEARNRAATLLLRGQCNDSYWHGIFGGLYSPHLRTAAWGSVAEAEAIADRLSHRSRHFADVTTTDFDGDGHDEIYFASDRYAALLSPGDGATIAALDFRTPNVPLINSLMRRPETYHANLRNLSSGDPTAVRSIHEQIRTKEEGLERWLHYDRWARNMFRLLLFGQEKEFEDFTTVQLEEDAAAAGGRYRAEEVSRFGTTLVSDCGTAWNVRKALSFSRTAAGFDVTCDVSMRSKSRPAAPVNIGMEFVLNFLAPSATDRYFESDGRRLSLDTASSCPGHRLRIVDEAQRTEATIEAEKAQFFWVAPINTVSESEGGFERIYQGSQILAVCPAELAEGAEWSGRFTLRVAQLKRRDGA